MSFLLHRDSQKINLAPRLPKATINQLETLRRAFELDTREIVADVLTRGIEDEFNARMAGIGVVPTMDTEASDLDARDRFFAKITGAAKAYIAAELGPDFAEEADHWTVDDLIARAFNLAARDHDDPEIAAMRLAPIGSAEPGGNNETDADPFLMVDAPAAV